MYTQGTIENELNILIVPPLPKEVIVKLPKYFKPTKKNLATQYYYWSRELIKQNRKLQDKYSALEQENQNLKKRLQQAEQEKEDLKLERDKFKSLLFKFNKQKKTSVIKSEPKPRDRQSYTRPIPVRIDEKREAILKQCPHCDSKLSKKVDSYERIIEDIPDLEQIKAKTTQYTINRYYCKHCNKIVSAKPKGVLPKSRLGTNTLMYTLYSKYRLRLPHNLIRENLETHFNLKVSDGQITNLLNKGQLVFKDKWQEIIETIKQSKSVNADETGWGDDWLWVFDTDKAVRYTISEFRGKGTAERVLGNDYKGVVISDFYGAYNQFKHKQRCWAHLLRKAKELKEQKPNKQRTKLYHQLSRIHQNILLFRLMPTTTQTQRDKKAKQIKQKLLVIGRRETDDHNLQKLLNRCHKYADELVICIRQFNVSPDNNRAERAIRPAVVMRKISGSSRSQQGAFTHEVNLSVIETLRKEKNQLLPAMEELVLKYITSIQ